MKMTRIAAVLAVLALGASGAVLACEYESPASSVMLNATRVPEMAFRQAGKPIAAPVSKQAITPAAKPMVLACAEPPCKDVPVDATTTGKKSVTLASMKVSIPKD